MQIAGFSTGRAFAGQTTSHCPFPSLFMACNVQAVCFKDPSLDRMHTPQLTRRLQQLHSPAWLLCPCCHQEASYQGIRGPKITGHSRHYQRDQRPAERERGEAERERERGGGCSPANARSLMMVVLQSANNGSTCAAQKHAGAVVRVATMRGTELLFRVGFPAAAWPTPHDEI